jgi:glycosyltransferase involved in cell wall biosynthesis
MQLGGVDESRITVIYQSFAPRFSADVAQSLCADVRKRYSLPQRYILNVGTVEARKNVLQAVKALPLLPADVSLVIVGRPAKYAAHVSDYVRQHGLESRVHLLHGVPDGDLPAIYAMADTFVYPSVYEGFGIPIIEAISCGLPVVACTGSCLEEAGGPDSLYVAPGDVEAMATAIRRTLRGADGREERIAGSRQYIRRFEGSDVAGQVYSLYERLMCDR